MSWKRIAVLLALSAGPAGVEAAALRSVRFGTALALAPQITAPSPYGSFHDLRWILVYHSSWPAFAAELAAALLFRSALVVALVTAAWPGDGERPGWRRLFRHALLFHAIATVVLVPWAAIAAAAAGTSLSWFLLGEIIPVAFLGVVLPRGGITVDWWRGRPTAALAGWGVTSLVAMTAEGMAVAYAPGWWAVPASLAAGTVNGALWHRLVRASVRAAPRLSRVPVTVVAVVALFAAFTSTGAFAAVGERAAVAPVPAITGPGVAAVTQPVIFVDGYDTVYDGGPDPPGLPIEHFSYRGVDASGRSLPYRPVDTHQSLAASAALLYRQVDEVHRRTGRPVALVAQSEGTLVLRAYLEGYPHPDVNEAVLFSPLVRPGQIYFPPPGARSGWGVATGTVLRGVFGVVRATGGPPISADEPFMRSVLDDATLYRDRMLCPVPGVRMMAFLPLADAVVVPPGRYASIPVVGLPGLHAGLIDRSDVQAEVLEFLSGGSVRDAPGPLYPVVQRATAGWQAPALALGLNPAWHAAGQPDASFDQDGCQARTG